MKKEEQAQQARFLEKQIRRLKSSMGQGYFTLGRLLKEIRDEKLHRLLDYHTMGAFIAQPELAFSRTSVYDYIHMYEMYVGKLGIDLNSISDIVYSQLRKILPVVEKSPPEWIEKARTLSRGDLTIEVKESYGEVEKVHDLRITPSEALESILSRKTSKDIDPTKIYMRIVSQCEICPICSKAEDLTPHHFPRTHARGGKEEDWKRIPLCLQCHEEAQDNAKEWGYTNRVKIQNWFYNVIKMLVEKLQEEK